MRMRMSMVFQKPNAFPKSVFENVAFGLRLRGVKGKDLAGAGGTIASPRGVVGGSEGSVEPICLHALRRSAAASLYRAALATDPEMLLFDEPTSALDPIATQKIEDLIFELKSKVTVVICHS